MKKEIVLITTWDNEVIELNASFDEWIKSKNGCKARGEDGFKPKGVDRYIKFANIKDERGKTQYLSLEAPKNNFVPFTKEDRKNFIEIQKKVLAKTFEGRKKKFLQKRDDILKSLAKDEERFGLLSTLEKIDEFNKLKVENLKLKTKYENNRN